MKKLVPIAACLVLMASCGTKATDDGKPLDCNWTSYRGNSSNTGAIHSECSPQDQSLELKWKYATNGAVDQSPVAFDGKAYIGSVSRNFHCINLNDGSEAWVHQCDEPISTPAAISGGKVVFGTKGPYLHCLDAKTGEEFWKKYSPSPISIPAADGESVYFGTTSKRFSRLDLLTGEEVWSVELPAGIKATPAFAADSLIAGCFDGSIVKISKSDGKIEILTKSTGAITTAIVIEGSRLYYSTYDGKIHCFDMTAKKEAWVYNVGIPQESSPTLWKGRLYFGANNGYFYCLSAQYGTRLWIYDTGLMRRIIGCPVASNGMVWFGSEDNYVYCFDAISGQKLWSYKTADRIWSSPIVSNWQVIIGCNDGNIYCFGK